MDKKDVLEILLKGEKITKKVKTKRGIFTLVYPRPRDMREIEVKVADMLRGQPQSSFSKEQIGVFRAYATLDRVVVDAPEWWKNLASSEDCPDEDLIMLLYGRYLRLYRSIQDDIGKSGYDGTGGIGKSDTEGEDVGDGTL